MPDLDRFDEPSYGGEDVEFEDESVVGQAQKTIAPIKKYVPHIIAAVVLIAIGWFVYDYFIGSMVEVTISIEDAEGGSVEASLKVFAEGANDPVFKGSDSSVYTVSLKAGRYRYEAVASDFKPEKGSFDISPDEKEATIGLSADIDVKIVEMDVPSSLYVGGTRDFAVTLQNHSSESANIELVAEGDLKGMVDSGSITIPGDATQTVNVQVLVPSGTSIKDERTGDEKKGSVRIKYTNEKADAEYILYPDPTKDITLNNIDLRAKAKPGQERHAVWVNINNRNRFPIEDLTLSVEILKSSAIKNDPDDVLSWLGFTENGQSEITISNIPGSGSDRKQLQVILPMTAKKENDIKGSIILDAPYFPEPVKSVLTLDITEGAEYDLQLTLSPSSPIRIEWDDTLGKFEKKRVELQVRNTGQIELKYLDFSIENDNECSSDWATFIENTIASLPGNETKRLAMEISAPVAALTLQETKPCYIRYDFDNPVGERETKIDYSILQVTPEAG